MQLRKEGGVELEGLRCQKGRKADKWRTCNTDCLPWKLSCNKSGGIFYKYDHICKKVKKWSTQPISNFNSSDNLLYCRNITINRNGEVSHAPWGYCSKELGDELDYIPISMIIVISFFSIIALIFLRKARATKRRRSNSDTGIVVDSSNQAYANIVLNSTPPSSSCTYLPDYYLTQPSTKSSNPWQRAINMLKAGDMARINPEKAINLQNHVIPYLPRLEMNSNFFEIEKHLGCGNFGTVYKGMAWDLFYPGSTSTVAIKTINDSSKDDDVIQLISEIKPLSHIDLHCNVVGLMGACTSEMETEKEIWMLLEFCETGDLKNYLANNQEILRYSFGQDPADESLSSRLLIRWAYNIAKGMEYLSSKRIMHGDLAARNILLSSGGGDNNYHLLAKISDFGLSKNLYRNLYYKKTERNQVPWKWMAFEFLETEKFTMKSDVWSYGVVLWEIFSLGGTPYGGQTYDEVYAKLKEGYRLPCPEDIQQITSWPAKAIYDELTEKCFLIETEQRSTFSELVKDIECQLKMEELQDYNKLRQKYLEKSNLLLNSETRERLRNKRARALSQN